MKNEVNLVGLSKDFLIHQTLKDFEARSFTFYKEDWDPYFEPGVLGARLSNVTRWNGQFIGNTVASHSILVHNMVSALTDGDPLTRLLALLHDASEAFMSDIASPLKTGLPDYMALENIIMGLVHKYYEVPDSSSVDFKEVLEALEIVNACDKRCSDVECFTINKDYMQLMGYVKDPQPPKEVAHKYTYLLGRAFRDYTGAIDDDY